MSQLRKKTMKAFAWSFLEQGGVTLVSLLVQLVLARLLMPEAFGIIAILSVFLDVANIIAQSGFGLALVQRAEEDGKAYSTAFWTSIGLSVLLYALIFFSAPLIAAFYDMADLVVYLRVLGLLIFFASFNSIQRAFLQARLNFRALFTVSVFVVVISGASGIIAALSGWGIWALILQSVVSSVVSCVALMLVVPWKPRLEFSWQTAKELFSYGGNICLTGILNMIYTGMTELIIGKACDPTQLGYYSQGRKWPNRAISMVSNALQNVMFPTLSRLKGQDEAFRFAVRRMVSVGTFVIMPASALLVVIAEPLIALVLTEKWLPSVEVFQCVCISNTILILQLANLRAYMALGHSRLYLNLQIIKVAVGTISLGLVAFYTRDIYAVAIASVIFTFFAIIVVDMQPAKRILQFSRMEQLKTVAPIFFITCIAAVAAAAVTFFVSSYLIQLLLQSVLFVAVYAGISYAFRIEALFECVAALKDLLKREDRKN